MKALRSALIVCLGSLLALGWTAGGVWPPIAPPRAAAAAICPFFVVELADACVVFALTPSPGLTAAAQSVTPRIALDYADAKVPFSFAGSTGLALVAQAVAPRVTLDYADAVYWPMLTPPPPGAFPTPPGGRVYLPDVMK